MLKRLFSLLTLLLLILGTGHSQTYPVVSTTQIIPPYSVFLSDYAGASSDRLTANLYLQDQSQSGIQVKLKITITGDNGVKLETKPEFMPPPITLYAGTPEQISGIALQDYLEPSNLNISGLNSAQFRQSKKLLEGIYRFTVEAVEYRRNKTVSNPGTAVAWLILNDPPIWNLPQHKSTITASNPQNIFFSWMPMHTGSPNSAFTTEYQFSLYDLIPQNANPDEYVNIAQPIHQSSTMSNNLIYGPSEIPLTPGRKYAARLRAYDTQGRDMFKHNGYSSVLVFTYGQECFKPAGIRHDNITPHTADIRWTPVPGNTEFTVYYREKTPEGPNPWYEGTTSKSQISIPQLKPEHTYQYVIKGLCGSVESNPTEIREFTTVPKTLDTLDCNGNTDIPEIDGSPPLEELLTGDVINVGGFEGIITQARGGNGVFSGKCIMRVSNFNILLKSHFDDIHINQSYQVTQGQVIADRGPGIMLNTDEITATLDSLANSVADTVITDKPDDYLGDLEIIYELDPVLVNDSVADDLETIRGNLEELLGYGELSDEQSDAAEDLLDQIDDLLNGGGMPEESDVFIKSIAFTNSYEIYRDDGSGKYEQPQFTEQGENDINYPIAFSAGSQIEAEVTVAYAYDELPQENGIWLSTSGDTFVSSSLHSVDSENKTITFTNLKTEKLPDQIDHKELNICWYLSFDNKQTEELIGQSSNTLYVTMREPMPDPLYETVLHIGCKNAKGMFAENVDEEIAVVNKIFEAFETKNIKNAKGKKLRYYGDPCTGNKEVNELLGMDEHQQHNGQCGAFADLFRDITACHIIQNPDHSTVMFASINFHAGDIPESFLVEKWEINKITETGEYYIFTRTIYDNIQNNNLPNSVGEYNLQIYGINTFTLYIVLPELFQPEYTEFVENLIVLKSSDLTDFNNDLNMLFNTYSINEDLQTKIKSNIIDRRLNELYQLINKKKTLEGISTALGGIIWSGDTPEDIKKIEDIKKYIRQASRVSFEEYHVASNNENMVDCNYMGDDPEQLYPDFIEQSAEVVRLHSTDGKGQNSVNPTANFGQHVIVKIGNNYYDPSYGINHGYFDNEAAILRKIQNECIDGFYIKTEVESNNNYKFKVSKPYINPQIKFRN